jgi:hypothetical protein
MMRLLRRLFWLGLLAGGAYGAYRVMGQRQSQSTTTPEWPPLPVRPAQPSPKAATVSDAVTRSQTTETVPATDEEPAGQRWKPAVNGDCPKGYPLKANDNSRIFHSPGGRFYERTVAERCYANADDAIADGYRPAKA